MGMMELQPMSDDNHFEHIAQAHPDLYRTQAAEVALCYACNPIKWWGNYDEQAEIFKNYEYVVGIDMFLNESSYFYDVICPNAAIWSAPSRCRMQQATIVSSAVWKIRGPFPCGRRSSSRRTARLPAGSCSQIGKSRRKNAEFIATLNGMFRVKDEYSVPMDQKLDVEAFADSILKSNIDEEQTSHG